MSAKKENAENYELVGVEVTENGGYRVTIKKPDGTIVVVPPNR